MHRLFVALEPPAPIRRQLLELMGGVANAHWQTEAQLHLTLRFIGEVDRHRAEDVAAALGGIHHPRFEIALDGIGQFDRRGRMDNLWVGVTPHAPLRTLHNKVDQALARVGIGPDKRTFLPHITIARFGRAAGPLEGFIARSGGVRSYPFAVEDFCLYESQLTQNGSVYSVVDRYVLR
jgi:2'-5' RNA ligase